MHPLTLNRIQRPLLILRMQIPHHRPNNKSQLNLKVHIHALGLQTRPIARQDNGRGRLEEEKRLLWLCVFQLRNVVPEYSKTLAKLFSHSRIESSSSS